jgi:acetolactate synthase I/II/III large subunit
VDAAKRRPWIDWIHTARDQGSVVRHYVKWDDQPASPAAAREALLRANWIARTPPQGPVYINLDVEMQEAPLSAELPSIDSARFMPRVVSSAPPDLVAQAVGALKRARNPLVMMGRVSRSLEAWNMRVALAEASGAKVVTDLKLPAAFPTDHPLHVGPPAIFVAPEVTEAISRADVILSLDWLDLAGTLKSSLGTLSPAAQVIHVSMDHHLHNGWSMDYQGLPPVDLLIAAEPDVVATAMLQMVRPGVHAETNQKSTAEPSSRVIEKGRVGLDQMAYALRQASAAHGPSLLQLPLGWNGAVWPFRHPLDYVGSHAGGGVGRGPGFAVGAALALKGSGRLPVAVVGDGDFLMGATAIWTAVRYGIPLMLVVANNRSFFNDELHQERMARVRGRPVENRWVGQRIDKPEIDLAQIASAQGAVGLGPIKNTEELLVTFKRAIDEVERGAVAVVDVHVEPGYSPPMTASMAKP